MAEFQCSCMIYEPYRVAYMKNDSFFLFGENCVAFCILFCRPA